MNLKKFVEVGATGLPAVILYGGWVKLILSGNSGGLPRPCPLRTGLEPFDSSGSGSQKAD